MTNKIHEALEENPQSSAVGLCRDEVRLGTYETINGPLSVKMMANDVDTLLIRYEKFFRVGNFFLDFISLGFATD